MKVHTVSLCIHADNTAYQKFTKTQFCIVHQYRIQNKHLIQAEFMSSQSTSNQPKTRAHTSRKARTEHSPFIILAAKTSYIQRSAEAANIRLPARLLRAAIYTLYWWITHRLPALSIELFSRIVDKSSRLEPCITASYKTQWRRHVL